MSAAYLGDVFDIHGGGLDLIFPHHENEIAQSRCAHGTPSMANYWMHNGFLEVEGEKMSKSDGNFVTIRELLKDWPGEVLRLNMLKTHYRSPIDWTVRGLEESAKTLDDWYWVAADVRGERPSVAVIEALSDDLNTPQMIASLHGLRNNAASGNERDRDEFAASLRLLGFLSESCGGLEGPKTAGERCRRQTHRRLDFRSYRRPRAQGLQGIRSHPRRTRGDGRRHQGFQGRHHLGDRAMSVRQPCLKLFGVW